MWGRHLVNWVLTAGRGPCELPVPPRRWGQQCHPALAVPSLEAPGLAAQQQRRSCGTLPVPPCPLRRRGLVIARFWVPASAE